MRSVRHRPLGTLPRLSPLSRHSNPVQSSFGQLHLRPIGALTRNANDIPSPSVASMRFVPLPTLVRPTSSPPFCRNEAAIEELPRRVKLPLSIQAGKDCLPDLVPHLFSLPALQPPPRSRIRSVLSRHVLPPASCPQDVQDPIEHLAVVRPRAAHPPLLWQERHNPSPLLICQFIPPHVSGLDDSVELLQLLLENRSDGATPRLHFRPTPNAD